MALYGGLAHENHFSEFGTPLESQAGTIAAATRKAMALANLGLTATAAELNALDGITASVAELNIMDGVTATATEINKLDIGTDIAGLKLGFMPVTVQQALSGAGAVNLTTYYTAVTNTGSDALTLADSTVLGHLKKVKMIVDPGTDSTLTFNTNATIVFADVGDYAVLIWDGADWIPIELGNDADGATAPVYTPAS